MPTTYDRVPYAGLPFRQTHPDRLASLAILFGMEPAPVGGCRVLELGCADGGNLIPMAFEYPKTECVGIDLAQSGIEAGRKEIRELGLTNIRLEHMDIMDAGPGLGMFDFIIAHGFYSWAPEPVRNKLMAIAGNHLAPQGVAYISYNTLPGCGIREMFREMLQMHTAGMTEPQMRLENARELLECVAITQEARGEAGQYLKTEARHLIDKPPAVLFHDEMGEIYQPVFFRDFMAYATLHGLQFLAEASYPETLSLDLPQQAVAFAERCSAGNRILRHQYFDFFRNRAFRQTLLCHVGIAVPDQALTGRVPRLHISSTAKSVSAEPDLRPEVPQEFRTARGATMTAGHPVVKAAMVALSGAWPESMSFDQLLASAGKLAGEAMPPEDLAGFLLTAYGSSLVEFHTQPPPCVSRISRFPKVTSLVRWQASHDKPITSAHHTSIAATGLVERRFLALLDGTRDVAMLARELQPVLNQPEELVARDVDAALGRLAGLGLLRG